MMATTIGGPHSWRKGGSGGQSDVKLVISVELLNM
jgi:hypothetical protein